MNQIFSKLILFAALFFLLSGNDAKAGQDSILIVGILGPTIIAKEKGEIEEPTFVLGIVNPNFGDAWETDNGISNPTYRVGVIDPEILDRIKAKGVHLPAFNLVPNKQNGAADPTFRHGDKIEILSFQIGFQLPKETGIQAGIFDPNFGKITYRVGIIHPMLMNDPSAKPTYLNGVQAVGM